MKFEREIGEIYRLKVPFMSVYTSIFLIKTEQGNALVDCATYPSDIDEILLPALTAQGLRLTDIKYLILTHHHNDHAGGKERVLQLAPHIKIVQGEEEMDLNGVTVYELKGHTLDCIGVFDERCATLISGDGLQGAGIKSFRCSLESKDEYLKTLERIEKDERITTVLFSHAYEPWYNDGAFGREEVVKRLQDCRKFVN